MQLPDFLSIDDGGFIHVTGHRVGLHHLMRRYCEGHSPEMIALEYPTVPLSLVHKVIAFYLENQQEVDAYAQAQDDAAARMAAQYPANPSLSELRKRFEAVQRAHRVSANPSAKA